jgi:hypothetical protein
MSTRTCLVLFENLENGVEALGRWPFPQGYVGHIEYGRITEPQIWRSS